MSTIVALSSGRPPAAIGVVRISGPDAFAAAASMAGSLPEPRRAGLRALRDADGRLLDRALILAFPGSGSVTGEDLVELHCHGGRAVVAAVISVLSDRPHCRIAEPGEFTRRALVNGRVDLSEAEGLADLLEAETESQRVAALDAAEGRISRQVRRWLATAAALSARLEAMIDYADEDGVEQDDVAVTTIARDIVALRGQLQAAASALPVERLRDGLRIVIAGPPNAGKSTLLNLLCEREAAIVTPIAGTTRDLIEAGVIRGSRAFTLTDTAGLTESDDVVEAIGVDRAKQAVQGADLVLWVSDEPPPSDDAMWIHARADLHGRDDVPTGRWRVARDDLRSIEVLWGEIVRRAESIEPARHAVPWRERHQRLCAEAARSLEGGPTDPILMAEGLRSARVALAKIIGVDATEEMLDALFSRFCLGK